jgi:hypothetical protein
LRGIDKGQLPDHRHMVLLQGKVDGGDGFQRQDGRGG